MTSEENRSATSALEEEEKQPVKFPSVIARNGKTEEEAKLDLRQNPDLGNLQLANDDRIETGSHANNRTETGSHANDRTGTGSHANEDKAESEESENKRNVEPHKQNLSSALSVESDVHKAPSIAESDVYKDTQVVKQTGATNVPSADGQQMTGYLQQVITSLQSSTGGQSESHDHVMISRWELTQLVKQTLAAQTMCTRWQQLDRENMELKQEKHMLIELILQAKQWQQRAMKQAGRDVGATSTCTQVTGGQVFCFDIPFPKGFSGQEGDKKTDDNKSNEKRNDSKSSIASQVESDGESLSLQLPSQLNLDGDPPSDSQSARGASGNVPHQIMMCQSSREAGPSDHPSVRLNLPDADLIAGAHCYSVGVVPPEGAGVSGAVVSREEYDLVLEELEKTKRHVHKLFKDGGIHPDTALELAGLKSKLSSLQTENMRLEQELASRPTPETMMKNLTFAPEQKALVEKQIQNRDKQIQMKNIVIHTLNIRVKELEELIRQGPQSQPPSNVGLTALPTIPATQLHTAETQTVGPSETENMQQLQQTLEHMKAERSILEKEKDKMHQQLIQARDNEMEHGMAKEKVQAQNLDLQQQLQEANKHRKELGDIITSLNNEMDKLNKRLKDVDHNRRVLEGIIADERKRYDRDEKELLGRLDSVSKEKDASVRLLLAADQSWKCGGAYSTGVPAEYTTHLTSLRRQYTSREPASHSGPHISSGRSAPRPNVSGSPGQALGAGQGSSSSQAVGQQSHSRSQGLIGTTHPQNLNPRLVPGSSKTAQSPQRQISDLSGNVATQQQQGNYYSSLPYVPPQQSAAHRHPGNQLPQHTHTARRTPQQHSGSSSSPLTAKNVQPHGGSSLSSGRSSQHPSRGACSASPSPSSASVPRGSRQHPQ